MNWQKEYIRVPDEFTNKFPDMSRDKAQKYYDTYLAMLRNTILRRMPFVTTNYIHVSLDKLWYYDFKYKKTRYYIWQEFKDIRPFFSVIDDKKGTGYKKGNPFEKNSEVFIMNQKLIDLLIDTADTKELVAMYYGDMDEVMVDNLELVPVDIDSITNFINSTQRQLDIVEKNSNHESTLYRNLRQAKYVKLISTFFYDVYNQYVLPQIPKPSPYGRIYYKGINIQNVSKEVRSAILGDHYAYDLNAAVYAIKLMLTKQILHKNGIDDFGHLTYTKEYLDWKEPLRKHLARHITRYPKAEKLVKEAITAIGFGARIGGGSWLIDGEWHTTSIEDIIMNPNDRKNFMNDPWIKKFVKEQQGMTKIIAEDYISNKEFVEGLHNVPNMFKNGKIRKSQVMSYVFQHMEKQIMDMITENIPVVARVHDSFITKRKLNHHELTEVKMKLNKLEPLMTIDYEQFHEWIDTSIIDEEELHRQHIKHEEYMARGYQLNYKDDVDLTVLKLKTLFGTN